MYHFVGLTTSGEVHCFRIKLTFEPDPSVVSFLPGLALIKNTVLESMRTLSYFRLDTLQVAKIKPAKIYLVHSKTIPTCACYIQVHRRGPPDAPEH